MLFELGTGDYLFHPHTGPNWDKDEDHLAQMLELLGKVPRHITQNGKYCGDFFNSKGNLRHISKLKFWAVQDLLIEKYEWSQNHALQFEKVLAPMLQMDPAKRPSAAEMIEMVTWFDVRAKKSLAHAESTESERDRSLSPGGRSYSDETRSDEESRSDGESRSDDGSPAPPLIRLRGHPTQPLAGFGLPAGSATEPASALAVEPAQAFEAAGEPAPDVTAGPAVSASPMPLTTLVLKPQRMATSARTKFPLRPPVNLRERARVRLMPWRAHA